LLNGGAGNDTLDGGTGIDTLVGGLGDDTFVLDSCSIRCKRTSTGTDTIRTSLNVFSLEFVSNIENLRFGSVGTFTATGNDVANLITGGDEGDTLLGLGGNDHLGRRLGNDTWTAESVRTPSPAGWRGHPPRRGGADTLNGDANNDTLLGGAGADHG